jgi:hypothetical protein
MAFSADELRVLRRALAEVLHPSRIPAGAVPAVAVPRPAEHVQDYLGLAEAVDDAVQEAGRLRAFLLAELRRYREALPGSAAGYLERLTAAAGAGYLPEADDLAALRLLRAQPAGTPEHHRRTALLRHCESLAENDVRLRLEAHMPAPRRLLALPGPSAADKPVPQPLPTPGPKPRPKPGPDSSPEPDSAPQSRPEPPKPATEPEPAAPPQPGAPKPAEPAEPDPGRRTPTPAEIWPPGRRPAPQRSDEGLTGPAALAVDGCLTGPAALAVDGCLTGPAALAVDGSLTEPEVLAALAALVGPRRAC